MRDASRPFEVAVVLMSEGRGSRQRKKFFCWMSTGWAYGSKRRAKSPIYCKEAQNMMAFCHPSQKGVCHFFPFYFCDFGLIWKLVDTVEI